MANIRKIFRASPENPSVSLADPGAWFVNLFGGQAESGVNVNKETALSISAVWRAIKILSEGVASLKWDVIEEDENGNKRIAKDHIVYKLLHEPSELYTGFSWREMMQSNIELHGNGYTVIIRDRITGAPKELRHFRPDQVKPYLKNGQLLYELTNAENKKAVVFSADVIHIPSLAVDGDGITGKSPLTVHKESLGLSIATTKYGAKFFKNGAHIAGYLTTEGKLDDKAAKRMSKSWKMRYTGVEKVGTTPVLEQGLKYQPLSLSPHDAMFIETNKVNVEDVARIFGVPLHLLGDLKNATFSNIEHQSQEFVMHTLRPRVKRWEAELNRKLFMEDEKARFKVRANLNSLTRGDTESQSKMIDTVMKWGIGNRDEVRRTFFDWNDISDGSGKKYYVPLNYTDGAQEEIN